MDVLRYRQHYRAVRKNKFKQLRVHVLLHEILPKLAHNIKTGMISLV